MLVSFKRILVATDYSPAAELALNYACSIANRFGAELHVLHVFEDPLPLAVPSFVADAKDVLQELLNNANTLLGEHCKNLPLESGVQLVRKVRVGYASDEIYEYASEHGIDLIVLGTQGRHGLSRFIMGSVAEKTVRLSSCPVLTAHCPNSRELGEAPLGLAIRTILVATDFSPAANRARDIAVGLATKFGAEVHLLNVVVEPLPLPGPGGTWIRPEDVTPVYVKEAMQKLADNVAEIEATDGFPITRAVKVGYPIDAIERYATDHHADLIVLGTQGHRGLSHLLLGSIAEKVVRMAACPVLTTH